MRYGFEDGDWEAAKVEARDAMALVASRRGMITYGDLFGRKVTAIALPPHDPRVSHFLDEISTEEDAVDRGMLSAVVVHKQGDMEPGEGFFDLATRLGRTFKDRQAFWVEELHRVHRANGG